MKLSLAILVLIYPFCIFAQSGKFKFRAREHYEIHSISYGNEEETYRGLTNTINAWHEVPFKYSFGLALGPILGSASKEDTKLEMFGEKIKLIHIGLEYKYFFLGQTFTRVGAGWTQLRSTGEIDYINGHHTYLGLGYEFKVNKFGIAVEAAYRWSELSDDVSIESITPSIGFHFYKI